MKLPRELGDLPYADALISYEGDLAPGEHYDGCLFTGTVFTATRADSGRFVECAFCDVALESVSMRRSRLSDVWLRDVRLLSTDLAESTWLDATFIGCAAAGVQAFDSGLRRVVFHECKLDSVNFRGATLTDLTFENCLLRDVDFAGATLKRTRFPGISTDPGRLLPRDPGKGRSAWRGAGYHRGIRVAPRRHHDHGSVPRAGPGAGPSARYRPQRRLAASRMQVFMTLGCALFRN